MAIAGISEPLPAVPAVALCGGVALFFGADAAYRWRDHHVLFTDRLVAAVVTLALIPVALAAPALVTLAALLAVGAVRVGWEARHRLGRDR